MDDTVDVLVHGGSPDGQVADVQKFSGINKIIVCNNELMENAYGDSVARIAQSLVTSNGYTSVLAATTGFGKDVIPRLGGLLDL